MAFSVSSHTTSFKFPNDLSVKMEKATPLPGTVVYNMLNFSNGYSTYVYIHFAFPFSWVSESD